MGRGEGREGRETIDVVMWGWVVFFISVVVVVVVVVYNEGIFWVLRF